MIHFEKIYSSLPFLIDGTLVTLKYTICSLFFGAILGLGLILLGMMRPWIIKGMVSFYRSIFMGTPLLLQLSIIYFALPQLSGIDLSPFQAGLIAFSLNSAAYVAEIIRAGIQAIDKGQFEAAKALGIPYFYTMRDIILPQALKNILPALVNEAVNLLKESSLVSIIGEMDLLRRATIIAAEKYVYFEPLIVIAAVYYFLVIILSRAAKILEKRLKTRD